MRPRESQENITLRQSWVTLGGGAKAKDKGSSRILTAPETDETNV